MLDLKVSSSNLLAQAHLYIPVFAETDEPALKEITVVLDYMPLSLQAPGLYLSAQLYLHHLIQVDSSYLTQSHQFDPNTIYIPFVSNIILPTSKYMQGQIGIWY
ncbi:hypothetical protein HY384_03490 [Candidatus Daviesbacteria bacterium]|nr:hypothetical protein [Candidatus Daviesbacteria bacterium]